MYSQLFYKFVAKVNEIFPKLDLAGKRESTLCYILNLTILQNAFISFSLFL